MNRAELTIVIPVYNEADVIGRTLSAIGTHLSTPHHIICVYDFPEDNTVPVVERYRLEHPETNLDLVLNDIGPGVLSALKKGFQVSDTEMTLVIMGDLSDDLSRVDLMVDLVRNGYDIVCGSRYMRGGKHLGGPYLKRSLSRMAGLFFHFFTGADTHDVSNNFRLYRTSVLREVTIESTGGFELGLEILAKSWIRRRRITQVPTTWCDREAGQSRFKLVQWLPKYLKWYFCGLRRNRLTLP